ncbi:MULTISPECIES: hypothetical protein [unclassified Paenibacillus]|uniref:hypothetical protein n=1 Tax=unclassified Paenibacillus TaxID=185978 RepID=UPI002F409979
MYPVWVSLERTAFIGFILISWYASFKATKLHLSQHEKELFERARKLYNLLGSLIFLSLIVVITNLTLHWPVYTSFDVQLVVLRIFCMLVPILMLWMLSRPKLAMLMKRTSSQTKQSLDTARRRHATHPDLAAPFQLAALGSSATAICNIIPTATFTWRDSFIAMAIIIIAGIIIWFMQHRNSEVATAAGDYMANHEERLRHRF